MGSIEPPAGGGGDELKKTDSDFHDTYEEMKGEEQTRWIPKHVEEISIAQTTSNVKQLCICKQSSYL